MAILTNTTAITATFEGAASASQSFPRGTALTATLSVLDGADAADLSDFTSLTLEVRPHAASSVVLIQKTLASGSFTAAPTLPAVHATYTLSDTETNINIGDVASADLHLVVHGVASAGRVTIATGTVTVTEDGAGTADTPASNPDIYYTAAETDAAIATGGTAHADLPDGGDDIDTANDLIRMWDTDAAAFVTVKPEDLAGVGGGDAWGDVVDADIVPDADGTRDLGATATRFAETYTDALDVTNNITVGGTVDGRDIAADGADIDANTAARHDAVTVADTAEIDLTLTGQQISGALVASSIDETKLDASVNASLDLADSASQPGHTHDPTTDLTIGSAGAGEQLTVNEGETALEFGLASKFMSARKGSAGTIAAGTPVYISGYHAGSSSIEIEAADQSNASAMPATGITKDAITNSSNGRVQISGLEVGLDTSTYSIGDALYVASGGGFTNVKPTTGLIQKIAIVARVNASNGSIELTGAGRANDIPNFTAADKYWYGGTGGASTEGDLGTGVVTALAVNVGSAGAVVTNGGALGTPSSGTLTNATGYPGDSSLVTTGALNSGSITSGFGTIDTGASTISTTGTVRTGDIELGHASDTTIARSAAGAVTVEGSQVILANTTIFDHVYIDAGAMVARTTNGATATTTELATNDVMVDSMEFATDVEQGVGFWLTLPPNWATGTDVKARFHWTTIAGAAGGVTWGIAGQSFADNDTMDAALPASVDTDDTWIADKDLHITDLSSAITITGAAAGERLYFEVTRVVGDTNDTMNADAGLVGVQIEYGRTVSVATAL